MYVATERKDIKFNYLHKECMTPIQYRKFCPTVTGNSFEEIVRGYEYQKGNYVVINEEDLSAFLWKTPRPSISWTSLTYPRWIPFILIKLITWNLLRGEKAYSLLIEAMTKTAKVAIAKSIIRSKQSLAALRVKTRS